MKDAKERSNGYFTAAFVGCMLLAGITWLIRMVFQDEMLLLFDGSAIWYAMPLTETIVALYVIRNIRKSG